MKQILLIIVSMVAGLLLMSCDQFYFSTPQPVDARNIYEFPNKSRGSWTDNGDSIVIGRTNFMSIEYQEAKVSLKEAKGSSRYRLKRDKVYITDEEKGLKAKRGFPYTLKQDTLFYQEAEIFELKLGEGTFLRKVGDFYLLNSKYSENWWEIYLVEIQPDESIVTRYLNKDDLSKIGDLKTLHVAENQYFLEANWTKKDLTKLLQKGVFSDTLLVLTRKRKTE